MSSSAVDPVGYEPPSAAREIAEGVYAYIQPDGTWWINNTGFLVGARGIVSVDACSTERRTRAYRDAITRVSTLPVRTLINTHHHGDHTFGNYQFDTATIVAHDNARDAMKAWGTPKSEPYWEPVDWGDVEIEPPFLTFTDEVRVYVDDKVCHVRHVATPAHTTNDSIVWIPEQRVLFSGDLLFNGGTPFLVQGSVSGELVALERLRALGAETIVPGHGQVCGPDVIETVAGYVRFVQELAAQGRAAGLAPLELARETDLGQYADLLDAERIVGNLHRAYAELDGAAPGARIDTAAALADMVTYNGGRPLTCHA